MSFLDNTTTETGSGTQDTATWGRSTNTGTATNNPLINPLAGRGMDTALKGFLGGLSGGRGMGDAKGFNSALGAGNRAIERIMPGVVRRGRDEMRNVADFTNRRPQNRQNRNIADSLRGLGHGNTTQRTALGNLAGIASGSQVGNNPHFNAALTPLLDDVQKRVKLGSAGSGRYGSAFHTDELAESLGNVAAQAASQQYNQDANRQMQAIGMQGNLGAQLAGQQFGQADRRMQARNDYENALMGRNNLQLQAANMLERSGMNQLGATLGMPGQIQNFNMNPLQGLFGMGQGYHVGREEDTDQKRVDEGTSSTEWTKTGSTSEDGTGDLLSTILGGIGSIFG